jgi:hypothetical protein
MQQLLDTWDSVVSGEGPRVMAVVAESGFGKTRLVQEFYGKIASTARSTADEGYWPTELGVADASMQVNPPITGVDAQQVMPFMWWGMRIHASENRNASLGSTVGTYVRELQPHTAAIIRAGKAKEASKRIIGGVVKGMVRFIPIAGQIAEAIDMAKEAHEVWQGFGERNTLQRQGTRSLSMEADTKRTELSDEIINLLRLLLRDTPERAPIPTIWLIDDAQYSPSDPGVMELLEKVLTTAEFEKWPLLILITHWAKEWMEQTNTPSVRATLHNTKNVNLGVIELGSTPWETLRPALMEQLPGLTTEQATALLRFIGGRPLLLEEIVRYLHANRKFFIDRNPTGPLKENELQAILAKEWSLEKLVEERLQTAPPAVRQFVTLSTLQGQRLLAQLTQELVTELANAQNDPETTRTADQQAERPHAFVQRTSPNILEFAQQVVYRVAQRDLTNEHDEDQARTALVNILQRTYQAGQNPTATPDNTHTWDDTEWELLTELTANLLTDSKEADQRLVGAHALTELVRQGNAGFLETDRRAAQIRCEVLGTPYVLNKAGLSEMDSWQWPLHMIDFETSKPALPFTAGKRAYGTVAFQFSHHIMERTEDGSVRVRHATQWISTEPGVDPNLGLVRSLKRALAPNGIVNGTVFRYNHHENTVLRAIYRYLDCHGASIPDAHELMSFIQLITRPTSTEVSTDAKPGEKAMVDLSCIVGFGYYSRRAGGSISMKYVLPAILHDAPKTAALYSKPGVYGAGLTIHSLNFTDANGHVWLQNGTDNPYASLPPIQAQLGPELDAVFTTLRTDKQEAIREMTIGEGGVAMLAFNLTQLADLTEEARQAIQNALLRYCELDTLAMVILVQGLMELRRQPMNIHVPPRSV